MTRTRRAGNHALLDGDLASRSGVDACPRSRPAWAQGRAAEPPKDPPVFRIGALLGLTDKGNWNATVMQRGIMMAVDEINAKGGIDGIKVEAAIEDHQGVPRVGVDALERLRARYDIQAVLLSYSTVALATAPICEQNKIFMLDGGSVSEALVGKFSYLFHNRAVATVLARAALTDPEAAGLQEDGGDGCLDRRGPKPAASVARRLEGLRRRHRRCRAGTGDRQQHRHADRQAAHQRARTSWRSGNSPRVPAWC